MVSLFVEKVILPLNRISIVQPYLCSHLYASWRCYLTWTSLSYPRARLTVQTFLWQWPFCNCNRSWGGMSTKPAKRTSYTFAPFRFFSALPLCPILGRRCSQQNLSYTGIVWTLVNPYHFREAISLWHKNAANVNKHNNITLKLYRDWFCLKEVTIEFSMLLSSTPSSTFLELLVHFSF